MKWIKAVDRGILQGQKTHRWDIHSTDGWEFFIGEVRWYAPWRKYCFFPGNASIFEQDCLRDLADFIVEKTKEHKNESNKMG